MKKRKYFCITLLSSLVILSLYASYYYYDVTYFDFDRSFSALLPEEVIKKLGQPNSDYYFTLTDTMLYEDAYREALRYRWSGEYLAEHPIRIREMQWHKGRRSTLVWFDSTSGKWRSVSKLTWGDHLTMN